MLCFCYYNNIIIRQSKWQMQTNHVTGLAMLIIIAGISAYTICVFI